MNHPAILNNFMNDVLGAFAKVPQFDSKYPFYNVAKTDRGFLIEMALAGFSKNQLKVEFDNNALHVSAEADTTQANDYLWKAVSTKSFHRTFALPDGSEIGKVEYKDGLLKVNVTAGLVPSKRTIEID